ncbi:hypothetical protein [Enterococcus phage vB_Efs6_KEN03]
MPCDGVCVPCLVSVFVKAIGQPLEPPLPQARRDSIP